MNKMELLNLTGLKSILNSKREDKIREEMLSLELQHKILHYFKLYKREHYECRKGGKRVLME